MTSADTGAEHDAYEVPDSVTQWVKEGRLTKFEDRKVFVHASGPKPKDGRGVLIVHGYPGSSWDWKEVVAIVNQQVRVVVPDMFGFGQSDKRKTGTYKENFSLITAADMYEAIAKEEGLTDVILVAHDMGQSVGCELMARQDEGKLSFKIRHAIILNGSTLVDMVELAEMQKKLLGLPDQAQTEHLSFEDTKKGMLPTFGKGNATDEILNCMTAQIFADGGDLLLAQTLRYLKEREEFYQRWVGALTGFRTAPMSVYWGTQDPVAMEAMADRIKAWRPQTDVYKMPECGHWPPIEVPEKIAKAIVDRFPQS
jgi:pimeloyl-ACP methyl ester carboxylesterase